MYSKSVFPRVGTGGAKLKINEKMLSLFTSLSEVPFTSRV